MNATLIVATSEMPRHLELVCESLMRQSANGIFSYEIIFCDDGSGPSTKEIIDRFAARVKIQAATDVSVKHLWQENKGFRKCKILNLGLKEARGETMIFLDGDCVPHRDFVRDHIENQEPKRYLAGRRVEVGQKLSEKLTPEMIANGFFDYPGLEMLKSFWEGDSSHLQRTVRVPWGFARKILKMDRVPDLKGCNYSVARQALLEINGFDEAYEGYGREDTDVEVRLQNLGLKIKSLKGLALQFHIWHPRREFTPANDHRIDDVKRTGKIRCEKGLA